MSYGTSSGNPGSSSGQVDIQLVQKKLHSLLEHLHWSYVALWSFNPQSRSLEWAGGHFKGNSPAHSNAEVWKIQLFNMQKTCTFAPGRGSVGMAFKEQRNIWMNGLSVHLTAGDEVQAKILEHARIQTAVYIPSGDTVLELGTSESVAEDTNRLNQICEYLRGHVLPALGHAQALPHVSQSPLAPLLSHGFPNQGFELNEQTRRMPFLSIDDMFLQHPNEDEELGITSSVPTEPTWVPSPTPSRPSSDLLQSPNSQTLPVSAANHEVLRRFQTYRSQSGTTSSSLSSLEDTSVKLSADSPDQSISLMAPFSQRHNSHNYASSSARGETPTHSPELQLVDTTGFPGLAPHLLEAFRDLLDSQEAWSQIVYIDPSLEPPNLPYSAFRQWRQTHLLRRRERSTNQGLLRRSFEILRPSRNPQQSNTQPLQEAPVPDRARPRRGPSSSSPEDMPAPAQVGPSSRGRRPSRTRGSGSYDEAANQHMLSERLRRRRQKENFADLRKLVPIISKNDKASILGDAIIYIKDLQVTQSRYEALKSSHQELQERNKQLEALVAAATSGASSSLLLPPPP